MRVWKGAVVCCVPVLGVVALSCSAVDRLTGSEGSEGSEDSNVDEGTPRMGEEASGSDESSGSSSKAGSWEDETPVECRANEISSVRFGEVRFDCQVTEDTAAETVGVRIGSDGKLQSIEGEQCTYHSWRDLSEGGQIPIEAPGCDQYFDCDGCLYALKNDSGVWLLVALDSDCLTIRYCRYDLGDYDTSDPAVSGTNGSGDGTAGTPGCSSPCSWSDCRDECGDECYDYNPPGDCLRLCNQGCEACCSP
jgi:hypothetical protein